jgi:hypothetical protein
VNIARIIKPVVQRVGNDPRALRIADEELKAFLGLSSNSRKYADAREATRAHGDGFAIDQIVAECKRRMKEGD